VQGVLEDGVLVREQQRVLEREQQHEVQEREQQHEEQEQEQEQEPTHHHSLWLRWRGSKKSFSSIRRRSFSKLRQLSCANC
jgi:hypothetical protein